MPSPHQFERFAQGHEGRWFAGVAHNVPVLRRTVAGLVFLAVRGSCHTVPPIDHPPLCGAAVGALCGRGGGGLRRLPVSV